MSLGKVALGAAGLAAVGGAGYLAYQHFQKPGSSAPGMGGMQQQPGMQPMGMQQPGMQQQPGMPPVGGAGGFLQQISGQSGGMRTDGFSVPGYEWQQGGGQMPAAPPVPNYGQPQSPPVAAQPQTDEQRTALLLVRAMVAAANADGIIDPEERQEIVSRLVSAGLGQLEQQALLLELNQPRPISALVGEVTSPELARQVYAVSLLAMRIDTDAERAYANSLPALLGLSPDSAREVQAQLGVAAG